MIYGISGTRIILLKHGFVFDSDICLYTAMLNVQDFVLILVLLGGTWYHFYFCNHLAGEERELVAKR